MKNSDVKLNTGSSGGEQENPLPDIETLAKIDALLKQTADECNAKVDFEKIKRRALAANKKRRKRSRLFERLALAAAACLMIIGAAAIVKTLPGLNSPDPDPSKTALNSEKPAPPLNTPVQAAETNPTGYAVCVYIGTAENANDSVEHISEAFRRELPPYMNKRRDDKADMFIAKGTDNSGHYKYCDCKVVAAPPYKLELGQLGKIFAAKNDTAKNLEFYWQIKKDVCLRIRFLGFDEREAQALMNRIAVYHP